LALAESLGSTTSSSDIALIASFGEEHRERFDAVNTHARVTCARAHSACEMFSFPKLQYFLAHLHAGLQMISISHLSVPNANFPRPVPLLRPASTRTMGSSLRASASARHASYTASAFCEVAEAEESFEPHL
jgi:hypothetical protein